MSGLNEADTCRKYVLPRLIAWEQDPHRITEQYPIDAGRILTTGTRTRRRRKKVADYLLCYNRDTPLAVVEAKRKNKSPYDGLQQAKAYAELLDLKFAVISHSNKEGLMRKPPEPQDYLGERAGGEHPEAAMSSKRWSTAFLP